MRFPHCFNAIYLIATSALFISAEAAFPQTIGDRSPITKALAPFVDGTGRGLSDSWSLSGLPGNKIALSRFEPTTAPGEPALRYKVLSGAKSKLLPPVIAVAVGADSDNTHGSSVAYIAGLRWQP